MKNYRKNVRKRLDGRYEARCIVGYEDIYGKAVYRYLYAKTYQKVVEKLELCEKENYEEVELQRALRKNRRFKKSNGIITEKFSEKKIINSEGEVPVLRKWLVEWLENIKKAELKNSSYTQYSSVIQKHLIPELGDYKLCALTRERIQAYVQKKFKKEKANFSPATIRRHISVLSTALAQAVQLGIIETNPCRNIVIPAAKKKRPDVFDKVEYRQLEKVLSRLDDIKATAILLALKTGLRLGELAALRWNDIDFDEQTITVRDAVHRVNVMGIKNRKTEMIFEGTKSAYSERVIPMNREIQVLLKKYETKFERSKKGEFVFSNKKGSFIDPRVYQTYFAHVLKTAGIRKRNFHILRHTFATVAASRNMQVSVLSRILGHANITTTLKLYVHPFDEQDRIEMNKISRFAINESA